MFKKELLEYVKVEVSHDQENNKEVKWNSGHHTPAASHEKLTITVRVHPEIKDSDNLKNTIGNIIEDIIKKAVKNQ